VCRIFEDEDGPFLSHTLTASPSFGQPFHIQDTIIYQFGICEAKGFFRRAVWKQQMKFGKQLRLLAVAEWRDNYVDYERLKQLAGGGPPADAMESNDDEIETTRAHVPRLEAASREAFVQLLHAELDKAERFFLAQQTVCAERVEVAARSVRRTAAPALEPGAPEEGAAPVGVDAVQASQDLLAASELIDDLRGFSSLNCSAAEKSCKKWDKHSTEGAGRVSEESMRELSARPLSQVNGLLELSMRVTALSQHLPPPVTIRSKRALKFVPSVSAPVVAELDLAALPSASITHLRVALGTDPLGQPICIPVMIAKGGHAGPVLGITSALHGNELNGIPIIHRLFADLSVKGGAFDVASLCGTILACPVVNVLGYVQFSRGYSDGADLNRVMPGKKGGTSSQQFCFALMSRIISAIDVLVDLHTASFGRVNSLYVRADMNEVRTNRLAKLQGPQVLVHNSGPDGSLRGACAALGKPAITVEIGNPQLFQTAFIERAYAGILNTLGHLRMLPREETPPECEPAVCARSMWLFTATGGVLYVLPELASWVRRGDVIAEVYSVFGQLEDRTLAPCDGIVVGKSTNPVVKSGDRVLHLGVVEGTFAKKADDGHA